MPYELRIHGRGGQGAVMAAEMLVNAFVVEGKYANCFPMFGVERRGAPVAAYLRFDSTPIRERTRVYHPDYLIVTDPVIALQTPTYTGLRKGGTVILNSRKTDWTDLLPGETVIRVVDATSIALEEMGRPITNSCMLGAFVGATGLLRLESLLDALKVYFTGDTLAKNERCAERGYRALAELINLS